MHVSAFKLDLGVQKTFLSLIWGRDTYRFSYSDANIINSFQDNALIQVTLVAMSPLTTSDVKIDATKNAHVAVFNCIPLSLTGHRNFGSPRGVDRAIRSGRSRRRLSKWRLVFQLCFFSFLLLAAAKTRRRID